MVTLLKLLSELLIRLLLRSVVVVQTVEVSHQLLIILNQNVGIVLFLELLNFLLVTSQLLFELLVYAFKHLNSGLLARVEPVSLVFPLNRLLQLHSFNLSLELLDVQFQAIVQLRMQEIQGSHEIFLLADQRIHNLHFVNVVFVLLQSAADRLLRRRCALVWVNHRVFLSTEIPKIRPELLRSLHGFLRCRPWLQHWPDATAIRDLRLVRQAELLMSLLHEELLVQSRLLQVNFAFFL